MGWHTLVTVGARAGARIVSLGAPLAFSLVVASAAACGSEPPRAPTLMRPIDEPHAVAIIARAFRELNIEPERNRTVHISEEKEIRLDVAAKGRKFGIAYITRTDADKLAGVLPTRRDPEALIVLRGAGEDADARAVLLFSNDYLQDDLSGEAHTATSIAAERKLEVAARDVIRKAEHEAWP